MSEDQQSEKFPISLPHSTHVALISSGLCHPQLSKIETKMLLKHHGDYLVQDTSHVGSLVLSVLLQGDIKEYTIHIKDMPSGPLFSSGSAQGTSLESLLKAIDGAKLKSGTVHLKQFLMPRHSESLSAGSYFGVPVQRRLISRCTRQSMLPVKDLGVDCSLVVLSEKLTTRYAVSELSILLEDLVNVRHRNILQLLDYEMYPNWSKTVALLRYEYCQKNLLSYMISKPEEEIPLSWILCWMRQAVSVVAYLLENKCENSIICAQECYLDEAFNLKVSGVHNFSARSAVDLLNHEYYWRFCAPEQLQSGTSGTLSMIYNYGIFCWQLSVACRLQPFEHLKKEFYPLYSSSHVLPFPGYGIGLDCDEKTHVVLRKQLKTVSSCHKLPQSVHDMILKCISRDERPGMLELSKVISKEAMVSQVVHCAKKLPFF